jgi:glycosyltransferase involved in cell wall biosynthesis
VSGDALAAIRGVRIAHLIESDGPGGAERTVVNLASALQAAGCPGVIVVPTGGEGWLAREAAAAGVLLERFDLDAGFTPAAVRRLAALFRRHAIRLAHSHEFAMSVLTGWAARRAGAAHVATMHGSRYYAERLRRRLALRASLALGGRLVAVSRQLAGHLSRDLWIPQDRIVTIANGIGWSPAPPAPLRRLLGIGPTDPLILAVGNLYPVKGHAHLVTALAHLAARHPTAHLAIAGRGELGEALRALARRLGLERRVHLLGFRCDVPALLAAADVFVLPSLSEGLPLSLLEAMFAGRPVVASDTGDVRTVLDGGRLGLLVEPGNATQLAAALDRLLTRPAEAARMGAAAAAAVAPYHLSSMVAGYAELYRAALNPRGDHRSAASRGPNHSATTRLPAGE